MKGDFTRSTFDRRKHYSGVRMQQGRVQLDADWNEQVDIRAHAERTEVRDVVGASGTPRGAEGFEVGVSDDGKELLLLPARASGEGESAAPGRMYVDGLLCEIEDVVRLAKQPHHPDYRLPEDNGEYVVYLDVWERHVTAFEDPALREPALGGPDTTTRTAVVWRRSTRRRTSTGWHAKVRCCATLSAATRSARRAAPRS